MKKLALIETAVCLFSDQEFDAATTQTIIKGHATGRRYLFPLKSGNDLPSCTLKKSLAQFTFCAELLEKAGEVGWFFRSLHGLTAYIGDI